MSQLYQHWVTQVQRAPKQVAVIQEEDRWTAEDLNARIDGLAAYLKQQGIQTGDRVGIQLLNQKEFLVAFFAILKLQAVVVPINIQLPADDIAYVLQNAGVRLLITNPRFASLFENSPLPLLVVGQPWGEQPAFESAIESGQTLLASDPLWLNSVQPLPSNSLRVLIYTSGTTARPKGVMLSEENIMANMAGFSQAVPMDGQDTMLMALPLFHAYGLTVSLYAATMGLPLVLVPTFNPKQMIQTIAQEQVTVLPLVPTVYSFLAEFMQKSGAEAFKSLRLCISGGASLPATLLKTLEQAANITILEGYGLTEAAPVVAVNRSEVGSIPHSVGQPLPNLKLRLVGLDGEPIERIEGQRSEEGEVQILGPNVMLGYYQLPEETEKVMTSDGWLKTGDLGHFDANGNLYLSGGRIKELIIKAGENVSPLKVESVLYQHPAVAEACVFGLKDDRVGEEIAAGVRLKADASATPEALRQFCLERLNPFLTPKQIWILDELPKNATGKILRAALKAQVESPLTAV